MPVTVILTILCTILVLAVVYFGFTTSGREAWHNYWHGINEADEVSYKTRKEVEDTARSYIASYNADVAIYEAYKNSENEDMRQYAESARMRAIRTATTYNEFILKNSYVWKDNIPADIFRTLDVNIE